MPEIITAFLPFALAAAPPAAAPRNEELTLDPRIPDDREQLSALETRMLDDMPEHRQTSRDAVRPTASTARCLTARGGHANMENERSL